MSHANEPNRLAPQQRPSPLAACARGLAQLAGEELVIHDDDPAGKELRLPLGGRGLAVGALSDGGVLALAEGAGWLLARGTDTPVRLGGVAVPEGTRLFAAAVPDAFSLVTPTAVERYQRVGGELRLAGRVAPSDPRTATGLADGSVVCPGLRRIAGERVTRYATPGLPVIWHLAPGPGESVWASDERGTIRLLGLADPVETRLTVRTGAEMIVHLDGDAAGVSAILADGAALGGRNLRLASWDAAGQLRWQVPLEQVARRFVRQTRATVAVGHQTALIRFERADGRVRG